MQNKLLNVRAAAIQLLTPRVREYLLTSEDGTALPRWQAGSHIEVHTQTADGTPMVRHYSLVGAPTLENDDLNSYRIAVQREDRQRGSQRIHDSFEVGTQLKISHPINNFPLDRHAQRTLLIAGGIGITPVFSMLRTLVRQGREFELLYAGRSAQEMAYREQVQALAGDKAHLHTSAEPADLKQVLARQPPQTVVYVCGPQAMVQATQAAAAELNWDPKRVRHELFGVGSKGDEVAFDVELRQSGRVVRVGRESSILDALHGAGIHPLFDCRRGECGLCATEVLGSDGSLVHCDRFLSEQERGAKLCICVSRTTGSRLVLNA